MQLHPDAIRRCNAMQRVRKVCVAHCESTDNDLGSRSAGDVHRTTQGSIHPSRRLDPRSITEDVLFAASPISLSLSLSNTRYLKNRFHACEPATRRWLASTSSADGGALGSSGTLARPLTRAPLITNDRARLRHFSPPVDIRGLRFSRWRSISPNDRRLLFDRLAVQRELIRIFPPFLELWATQFITDFPILEFFPKILLTFSFYLANLSNLSERFWRDFSLFKPRSQLFIRITKNRVETEIIFRKVIISRNSRAKQNHASLEKRPLP